MVAFVEHDRAWGRRSPHRPWPVYAPPARRRTPPASAPERGWRSPGRPCATPAPPSRRSRCGNGRQAAWTHSPPPVHQVGGAELAPAAPTANRVGSQAGKSPPVMSPSRVARTHRLTNNPAPITSPPPRHRPLRHHPAGSAGRDSSPAPSSPPPCGRARFGIGEDGVALPLDLALQGAGVGGDPD